MIAILDYDAGNLTSVDLAVRHIGGNGVVTKDPSVVARAERVIFPGVGAAASAMANLRKYGLDIALKDAVASGKPVLAICIGIQLLFESSEEDGGVPCLGIMPGKVVRFAFPQGKNVKVPQMGWNAVQFAKPHPLFNGIESGTEFYFVHSYYPMPAQDGLALAHTEYEGCRFASSAGIKNLAAMQFHPEKSGRAGLALLQNFLGWDGKCA